MKDFWLSDIFQSSKPQEGAKEHGEGSAQFPVYDTHDPNTGYVLSDITSSVQLSHHTA